MKFVFRVDASLQIGTGHVMRCLTLAEELKRRDHQCTFIGRAHEGHLGKPINDRGFDVVLLDSLNVFERNSQDCSLQDYQSWLGAPWEQDAEETVQVLNQLQPDWLVVDHYAVDAKWERLMAPAIGRTMVIDDLANREHQCDLLLDQNLGRAKSDYDSWVPQCCARLIGPKYALLRPEFARLRGRSLARRKNPELKRILISMGGVDCNNTTGQVLTALAESSLPEHVELDIVLGSSAPFVQEVRTQAASLPFRATVTVDASDMAERMCQADLSIGAAGSTSWERCCLGLPTLLVVLADNQKPIGRHLEDCGAALVIESESILRDASRFVSGLRDEPATLTKMSHASARITEGLGSNSVCAEIEEVRH